jgi:hypothetical protein
MPLSVNAVRRTIAQVDHITPSAHYTAAGDSPFATSLDHKQLKRWHNVPGVENSPSLFLSVKQHAMLSSSSRQREAAKLNDPERCQTIN